MIFPHKGAHTHTQTVHILYDSAFYASLHRFSLIRIDFMPPCRACAPQIDISIDVYMVPQMNIVCLYARHCNKRV